MKRRRQFLGLGGLALVGALAGCSSSDGDADPPTSTEATTERTAATTTTASGDGGVPGADVLGGPDDLRGSAEVIAAALDTDQGAGQFVFTPAVAWIQEGATVTWPIEGAAHSVTAYAAGNDRPQRIPENTEAFDSGTLQAGETYEHTFERSGVYNYFCLPHEGLGMVGLIVVGEPQGGPGTTALSEISGQAASGLERLLELAGIDPGTEAGETSYGWQAATFDAYWYSLYNMSTNIAMSANGVTFPSTEAQREQFQDRFPAMLEAAGAERPPVRNPNLNMLPFTEGDPSFTKKPVLSGPDGRPDASTLAWDRSRSSRVVSPASMAWTHLKGVTWAKNFEKHFDILPGGMKPRVRAQVLSTMAQVGMAAALVKGGPEENGLLTKGDSLELVSGVRPATGEVVDAGARPHHHAAMLWFLSDLRSLAMGGWFGYRNPEPLIPASRIGKLHDGMGKTTMNLFSPDEVVAQSVRDLGLMLGAVGWFGSQTDLESTRTMAAKYADGLTAEVRAVLGGNGRLDGVEGNQAAAQALVGQGLLWASRIEGVDYAGTADEVLSYLRETLWDEDAGTFASGEDDTVYRITARDAGDITGGLNAADAVIGQSGVKPQFAAFFRNTMNRGRLQRAERPPSRDEGDEFTLPLPPAAGGEFGQAAVYNRAVEYDTAADTWRVVDDRFHTAEALYLANQEVWVGNWGGDFYQGRGVPGLSDVPPE